MPTNEHDHAGHRERMRDRFLQNGLDGFAPHETLELLLFYAIPRRNVNPLAHRLVKHFGSVNAVFEASAQELMQVQGIGETSAALLSMVFPLARYAEREMQGDRPILSNLGHAKNYCKGLFAGKSEEVLYVICLDAQDRVIRAIPAISGTIDELPIYPRTIVSAALQHNAYSVVLAHNHPSGVCEPSLADVEATAMLRTAFDHVDIVLRDHMIYAEGECLSMARWEGDRKITQLPTGPSGRKAADKKQPKPAGPKKKQEPTDDATST